jgi:hypothetical protein
VFSERHDLAFLDKLVGGVAKYQPIPATTIGLCGQNQRPPPWPHMMEEVHADGTLEYRQLSADQPVDRAELAYPAVEKSLLLLDLPRYAALVRTFPLFTVLTTTGRENRVQMSAPAPQTCADLYSRKEYPMNLNGYTKSMSFLVDRILGALPPDYDVTLTVDEAAAGWSLGTPAPCEYPLCNYVYMHPDDAANPARLCCPAGHRLHVSCSICMEDFPTCPRCVAQSE